MKKIVFGLTAFFCFSAAFSMTMTVISVEGKVELRDGSAWIALKKGDTIEKGAVISTGYKSEAKIKVEESQFTIGSLTRLTVEDLVSDKTKDTTQVFLDSGTIKANVKSAPDKRTGFKVRSAIATASVRGTEFEMSSGGRLSVSEGVVSFSPTISSDYESKGTPVAKGQSSVLDTDSAVASTNPSIEMEKTAALSTSVDLLSSSEAIGGTAISASPNDQPLSDSSSQTTLNVTLVF